MKIAFEEHGEGKPVILLHAFPLNRQMWRPQIEPLVAEGCRLILPDLRGFGESHSFSDIHTMEELAQDISDLMDAIKIDRAIIGGLSMGGYVAFKMLKICPEKFAAAVFCDTHPGADSDEKRESRFDMIEKIEKEGADVLIEEMLPNLFSQYTMENKKDLVSEIEQMFRAVNPQAAIAALRGMAGRKDNSDLLNNVSIPMCLIYGEEDDQLFLTAAEKIASFASNREFTRIPNAGHYSNLEQPEDFNRALVGFIRNADV